MKRYMVSWCVEHVGRHPIGFWSVTVYIRKKIDKCQCMGAIKDTVPFFHFITQMDVYIIMLNIKITFDLNICGSIRFPQKCGCGFCVIIFSDNVGKVFLDN